MSDPAVQQLKNLLRKLPEEQAEFDPGEHTVADIEAYIEANPDQRAAVLDAELAGKNRVTLVDWLQSG